MKENEAALVIQKWIRVYLLRRRQQAVEKASLVDNKCRNLDDDEKLQTKKVLEEVNLFYRTLNSNWKKKQELRKLCANIDEVSANLKAITKLEQCKILETSFCESEIMEQIKERHRGQIRQIQRKWWEKLDIYENP